MTDIDPITGLPKDIVGFQDIAKESQRIRVTLDKKKFGKPYTIITGMNEHEVDTKVLAKKLKNKFACGGTAKKGGSIELQGDHRKGVKDELVKEGFLPDTIDVNMFGR